jgi:tetratricopeptide (TPR) repeat protein
MRNPLPPWRAALLSAAVLLGLSAGATSAQTPAQAQRKKAREVFLLTSAQFLEDKDRSRAREGYLQAIRIDPTYPQPRYNLGVLAEADEDWTEAAKWFTEYLRLDNLSSYATKARAELGRVGRAQEQDSTPGGRRRRQYDEAVYRGRVLLRSGRPKEAVAEASAAAKIDDARWEAYALTADALSSQGLYVEAATFIQQAIERAPAAKRVGLQRVLDNYPKERQYRALGRAGAQALKARKYREAAADFISAWRLFPSRDEYGIAATVAYAIVGDKARAEALLTMLEQDPSPTTAQKVKEIRAKLSKQ